MVDRKHGHLAPPTDSEISHEDWDRQDVSGQRHTRVAFGAGAVGFDVQPF
jgi:fluoroquinolone resistance protein